MLISHTEHTPAIALEETKARLRKEKNLFLPLEDELALLEQLTQFELGRFLLTNKGLNGYWTAYAILYGQKKSPLSSMEDWLLNKAPGIVATRDRFGIFQKEILKRLQPSMCIASLPCGLMEDILSLDAACLKDIKIVGIDLDQESLNQAQEIAHTRGISNCQFVNKNAWDLNLWEEFDLLTSNGLNIYEPNPERLIALYKEFAKSLKPQGTLITSFLHMPTETSASPQQKAINSEDIVQQRALFQDIIQANWQSFQTEHAARELLEAAGFTVQEVIYDPQCLFPTVIACKK